MLSFLNVFAEFLFPKIQSDLELTVLEFCLSLLCMPASLPCKHLHISMNKKPKYKVNKLLLINIAHLPGKDKCMTSDRLNHFSSEKCALESHVHGLKTCIFHIHANKGESLISSLQFQMLPALCCHSHTSIF